MVAVSVVLVAIPLACLLYAVGLYPLLLKLASSVAGERAVAEADWSEWPVISVSLPAYNEEEVIGDTLEALLSVDYPSEKMQIVVVSDASSDRTDEIVREYSERGVELVALEERQGKTLAEAAAMPLLDGDIVVNVDASVRVRPGSMKPLIRAFRDPTVGVASGRDVSVESDGSGGTAGEEGYVGFEMWIRSLETRLGSIVGASGCFYAVRRSVHCRSLEPQLTRDFASVLLAREEGYRAVSVKEAICEVPRSEGLRAEFRRKVRTMERGLATLQSRRHFLNPVKYGAFGWMLFSHKLCRWLVPPTAPLAVLGGFGLALAGTGGAATAGQLLIALAAMGSGLSALAYHWPFERPPSRPLTLVGYLGLSLAAGLVAWPKVLRGGGHQIWEPTRRRTAHADRAGESREEGGTPAVER